MYTSGEFARMAQVSQRQLRHWDDLGLLRPQKVDIETGWRYYSANQLTALNRIVALKELGLSLDQIRRFIEDDVSLDEMQGMLLLRKAEIEQQVLAELSRVRNIESRLKQIRESGKHVRDVVVKHIPEQMYLGMRSIVPDWESTLKVWEHVTPLLPEPPNDVYGDFLGILHADGVTTDYFDMEVGRILHTTSHPPLATQDGQPFTVRLLPASEMATFVHKGSAYEAHIGFGAVGEWAEMNHYVFAGPMRGIILHPVTFEDSNNIVVEMQFPIEKRAVDFNLLNSDNQS
ncbi:MAG: MerR family transcriptional regulator [Aggregatilineales bacterium]